MRYKVKVLFRLDRDVDKVVFRIENINMEAVLKLVKQYSSVGYTVEVSAL